MRLELPQVRRAPLALLAAYLVMGVFVVLQPEPLLAGRAIVKVAAWLEVVGAPAPWTTFARVEVLLNVILFAPITLLGRLALPTSTWSQWVAWSFIGSFGVELAQEVFLSVRTAEYSDIVANTLGALLGVVLASIASTAARR